MSRVFKKVFLILWGGAFCLALTGQVSSGIGWKDYDFIKQSDRRLTGYNGAGLRYLPVDRIATASFFANKGNGKFISYSESDNWFSSSAQTEAFYRLSPRVVFFGSISYENFIGRNMGGSSFIHPYENPFDIVEYADTTRGKKNLETYRLTGALSADLTERLTLGVTIDYQTANYAKQKDLRHKNRLLDLSVAAGLSYRIHPSVELGGNYYYRRSVEGVEFKMYGTTDRQYYSLINYGAFFGKTELFSETGYTENGENNPMYNHFHGASVQVGIGILPEMQFFNELTRQFRKGEFGKHSPNKIVHSRHHSDILAYNGSLAYRQGRNVHQLNAGFHKETLENFENVYKAESKPGGTSMIVYYDPLKVGDREQFRLKVEYTAYLDVRDHCPAWTFRGGVDFYRQKLTASFYPFYRKQTIRSADAYAGARRKWINGRNKYTLSLSARYVSGGGTMRRDGEYAPPGENQTRPKDSETNLRREYEYLTTDQLGGDIGLEYARLLGRSALQGFAALHYSLKKGLDVEYLGGDDFHSVMLSVGCIF